MIPDQSIVIAGIGVKSAIGENLTAFSHVLYEDKQPILETPYTHSKSDVVDAAVEALKDAGVPSDAELTVWICGEISASGLVKDLADYDFTLSHIVSSPTLGNGLKQAVSSLYAKKSALALVIAKDDMGIGALLLSLDINIISGEGYAVFESQCLYDVQQSSAICQDALTQAGIDPGEIGYFEVTVPDLHDWVLDAYRDVGFDLTCAWGSLAGNFPAFMIGQHLPNFSICSLIKTLLALYRRTLPAFPGWELTGERRRWQHTPFYTIQEARPWFVEPGKLKRYAAWLEVKDDYIAHMVFSEPGTERDLSPVKSKLGEKTVWLLPVTGRDQQQLQQNLSHLKQRFDSGESILDIFQEQITHYEENHNSPYALAVVGRNRDEVIHEIALALNGVQKAFTSRTPYRTPRGSVFTPDPQRGGDVAFVYPGAFNSYVGFGRELLQHFPFLHERLSVLISNVGRSLAERILYPRSLERLTNEETEAWALRLTQNPIAMIESGTTFAIAYSLIMRELFDVHPHSAMGYSLGEISMLWSAGVWNTGDAGSAAWHASPLFKTRLFGPKQAVREAWDIKPEDDEFWSTYVLKAPEEQVRALVEQEPRVYLTIVNLPEEVVIAGDGAGCQRIIKTLGCHAIRTPFDSVIHNEVVRSDYDTFVKLYTHPVNYEPDVVFYSAAEYAPLEITADSLAHSIAKMTCKPVHLPRLVDTVYEGGARIFIELGPQATCSRWINRILNDKPHVAVPINRIGMGDFHGVITVLAQLITNRIHVNLQPLLSVYQEEPTRSICIKQAALLEHTPIRTEISDEQLHPVRVDVEGKTTTSTLNMTGQLSQSNTIHNVFHQYLLPQQQRLAQNHMTFLQTRHLALQDASTLIEMQMAVAGKILNNLGSAHKHVSVNSGERKSNPQQSVFPLQYGQMAEKAMYTKVQLDEFATGNVERCFGEDYAIYRGRRLPRIPNGDLLLMDRIMSIDGTRGVFSNEPALHSEFDVPPDAWFFADRPHAILPPVAVLMEIALQPCGFLAAYLGSTLATPQVDYYFRNLDGYSQLLRDYPVRGKTIQNTVKLASSISLRGIIMQRYDFILSCEGVTFYTGGATFGYFTADALSEQVGLDKGKYIPPIYENSNYVLKELSVPPKDQLHGLDRCIFSPRGGRFEKGYIYGEANVDPNAWFFKCHFYQDSVMPGSLGVDLMYQSLELGMRSLLRSDSQFGYEGQDLRVANETEYDLTWMYRGQVTPANQRVAVDLHIKELIQTEVGITAIAEAGLWVDGLRIYSVSNLSLRLTYE